MKLDYTRQELIEICERAIVQEDDWNNRDSQSAQKQVGELCQLLKTGCKFEISTTEPITTNDNTIWIQVYSKGFGYFEGSNQLEMNTYYLPTNNRIRNGEDWY